MKNEIKFIAMGAGQCSSVLPFILKDYDLIIFADTGWEHPLTYDWCHILKDMFGDRFIWLHTNMPDFRKLPKKYHPPICTKEYKIQPTRRWLRKQGVKKAIKYLGITYEEKNRRSRINDVKWIENSYPLVERKMTRKDCTDWLLYNIGFVPIRSGCTICKYYNRKFLNYDLLQHRL